MVLHGLVGRRGRDFQEGAKEGERWESRVSSTTSVLEREGEKMRGLSAHSPSPRARHPNPRSRTHGGPRRPPGRDGEKRMTPFQKPGEMVNPCPNKLFLGQKNRNRRLVWPLREGREI